ncbi:hypothetical protein [Pontibacter populi]|uniref:Uncharacterized protein n=1 Tax=Pontibacter populi TaxID=890055 RepID=A0ABV1RY30_9BACT
MKKYLIPFITLLAVSTLSYMYNLVSFILLMLIALSLAFLLAAGILKIFRRDLDKKWLKIPLVIMTVCITGVFIGLFRPLEQAIINTGDASEKLAYAYKTDQGDRMTVRAYLGIFKDNMAKRDSIRLEQVNKLYKENQISEPIDKFYAAFIFHHSKKSAYFEIAQKLANEAASVLKLKDDYVVQWLAKATYDRWMVSLGKPEKYGTQDKFSVSVE